MMLMTVLMLALSRPLSPCVLAKTFSAALPANVCYAAVI
jgi:hypothetical protein